MIKVNWIRVPRFEKRCANFHVEWKWVDNIKLSDIDIEGSKENNARFGDPIHDSNVFSCGGDMEEGLPIDGMALRKIPTKSKMIIIDGNHRAGALDALHIQTCSGYIIKCTDELADVITRLANRGSGLGQIDEDAIEHAIHAHLTHGMPLVECAANWSLDAKILQRLCRNRELKDELEEAHINCEKMSKVCLDKMNPFRDQKTILHKLAHIISLHRPTIKAVDEMINALQQQTTEQQKLDCLTRQEQLIKEQPAGRKTVRATPKAIMFRLLDHKAGLAHLLAKGSKTKGSITEIRQLEFDPQEADKFVALWNEIKKPMEMFYAQSKDYLKQVDPANKKKR